MKHSRIATVDRSLTVGRALVIGILLNVCYAAVELVIGIAVNSLGLIADAGHNFSDVAGLLLAFVAVKLVEKPATSRYTYGYKKASILISLINALLLLGAVAWIVVESIRKFSHPEPIEGWYISVTALIGVFINFISARLLMQGKERDLNVRGAYLHMMLDALVSVGVVVSGVLISITGWNIVDPIVGLVIAAVILVSSWGLFTESAKLAVDGVPENVDVAALAAEMVAVDGVTDIHHLHVWALSTTQVAATAHIVVNDMSRSEEVRRAVRLLLSERGIIHVTLEVETCKSDMCDCC